MSTLFRLAIAGLVASAMLFTTATPTNAAAESAVTTTAVAENVTAAGYHPPQLIPGATRSLPFIMLNNVWSQKCLDWTYWGGISTYRTELWGCAPSSDQQWWRYEWAAFKNSEGWRIRNFESGLCLDHSNWGSGPDAILYQCHELDINQLWLVHRPAGLGVVLQNRKSGKCLNPAGSNLGAVALLRDCNFTVTSQRWQER